MEKDQETTHENKNWSFKTTTLRAGACLTICLLFVVEFQFDFSLYLHIFALTLFAIAIPLLTPIIVAGHWWNVSKDIGFEERLIKLSVSANIGALITILSVGLCLFSMHWFTGVMYVLSVIYSLYLFTHYLGLCPKVYESKTMDMIE